MNRTAPCFWLILGCLGLGCATMKPSGTAHPGITEQNPNAVVRAYPATATLVAQKFADVMSADTVLTAVLMTPDSASREFRNFSRLDRQALGISLLTPANDVNYNITAKSKDGHPVAVAVRLKGDAGSEASVLYGFAGDPDLSRDLLDRVEASFGSSSQTSAAHPPTASAR